MGLIRAAMGAAGGVMADQWKEYFYCEAMPADLLATRGWKRQSGRSANTKAMTTLSPTAPSWPLPTASVP